MQSLTFRGRLIAALEGRVLAIWYASNEVNYAWTDQGGMARSSQRGRQGTCC